MAASSKLPPLVDETIAAIAPYQPGKPLAELARELGGQWPAQGAIKLASNENPLGPSPLAVAAAAAALADAHLYPDGGSFYLRQRLARALSVGEPQIIVGSGSNELIDLIVQTFCAPDEEVLAPAYSFLCYRLSAQAHRRAFREVPNGPGFAFDLGRLAGAVTPRTKVLFIANPNNPTGCYADQADFVRFVDAVPPHVVLVVDEAYFEYVQASNHPNALALLSRRERIISLRTFSKIYGLAGLRVGYGVASEAIIGHLNQLRMAFNVSTVGQAAALSALDDHAHVERSRRDNAEQMATLASRLSGLGLIVVPSQANFLLVGMNRPARPIYEALLSRGVIVRPIANYGLPDHLRITVGTQAQNERLVATLTEVVRSPSRP